MFVLLKNSQHIIYSNPQQQTFSSLSRTCSTISPPRLPKRIRGKFGHTSNVGGRCPHQAVLRWRHQRLVWENEESLIEQFFEVLSELARQIHKRTRIYIQEEESLTLSGEKQTWVYRRKGCSILFFLSMGKDLFV